ncbi:MAG: molybdate ABC transporter substrate-binding protein [Halieaceae bacterium]|nr:molybdate ABC transporter substrate-binding protein [Halieaceae bacterium]
MRSIAYLKVVMNIYWLKLATVALFLVLMISIISIKIFSAEPTLKIAVASNFLTTANKLIWTYERLYSNEVEIISGSTGKLFAQINSGAPFDLFLAADSLRPRLLSKTDNNFKEDPYVYAIGRLVLWAPGLPNHQKNCNEKLLDMPFQHIALANPKTAPFGDAGIQTLRTLEKLQSVRSKLVFGENVGQVFSYIVTGAVDAGFLSLAQVQDKDPHRDTCTWIIPRKYYSDLSQSAIILQSKSAIAQQFMNFLQSKEAKIMIQSSGYLTP